MDTKTSYTQRGAKVGLISRIDYGSKGFRKSIIDAGFEILMRERVHFIILVGGLIARYSFEENMKKEVAARMEKGEAKGLDYKTLPEFEDIAPKKRRKAWKEAIEEQLIQKAARDLADIIPSGEIPDPENPKKKKILDLFIVTSPAFDGKYGEQIALELASLREDIKVWNKGGDRFLVKFVDKLLWALAPPKAVWMRSDYYSTAAERPIKDKIKQSPQTAPDSFVVGCFGSGINKPMGELEYAYVSVPALHRLDETRVNENQIGVGVMDYPPDNGQYTYKVYSLKDLVSRELNYIVAPQQASALQKKIIEAMKERGWGTLGTLEYTLKTPRAEIKKAMEDLMEKKKIRRRGENWPGIVYKESSRKYYFDLDWVQYKLKYPTFAGPWIEDKAVTFACLHAGSTETDYACFVNDTPKIILKHGADILVGAGDIKEGLWHNLDKKGEIVAGMNNNTVQEKVAAHMVGKVIFTVFETRFNELLKQCKSQPGRAEICDMISKSLLWFYYIPGNHDLWESNEGHTPLEIFRNDLINYLVREIAGLLGRSKIGKTVCEEIADIVEGRVLCKEFFILPSGLRVSVQHPHMSRTKTTSLRPQEMLRYAKRHGCQIAIGGNFHVSENVPEWDMDLGQCVCQEIGTLKHGSNFERRKMKMVDQGIGYLRVISQNQRIFMVESAFYGGEPKPAIDNLHIVNMFLEKLNIKPIQIQNPSQ